MISRSFEELEKKCKKIKRKRVFRVLLIIFISLAIIFLVFFSIKFYEKPKSTIKQEPLVQSVNKKNKPKKEKITESIKPKPKNTKTKKNVKEAMVLYLKPQIYTKDINISNKDIKKQIEKPAKKVKEKMEHPNFTLHVEEVKKTDRKFKDSYMGALGFAKQSFIEKKYIKCIYWAKKASKLDSSKDEPWILYAKAKYNLNKKDEAIESLRTYLNYFHSKKAVELLKKYEKIKR